jgi:gamma-glutamyltranspeptidase / glutathione hydrolase
MHLSFLKVPVAGTLRRFSAVFALFFIVVLQTPAQAARDAIASGHPLATEAGMRVLAQGGNAFDAAVAVAATLAVVEPYTSGLGGGGFFLLHRATDGFEVMVDARETAPGRARPDLYIGADGRPDEKGSIEGARAAAIPGAPAGLAWLAQKYGRLSLATSLAPAMRLAYQGFPTDQRYKFVAGLREGMLKANPQLAAVFLDQGAAPAPGFIVRQPDLGRTLEALAAQGRDGFYTGDVAKRMVTAVQAGGGLWELDDLRRYKVVERPPQHFTYRGARIT